MVIGLILFADPPPPSTHRPGLDPVLEAICLRAFVEEGRGPLRLDGRFRLGTRGLPGRGRQANRSILLT